MSKCDIIIPVWNQLENTSDCINSLKENTGFPFRLIIVDNASDEDTKRYLESLRVKFPDIILVRNDVNEGFVKAINRGIARSDADYLCILNNDTVVTRGWLSEIVRVAEADPEIGIVNPSSNNLGQRPAPAESIYEFSEKLKMYKGKYIDLGAALGFCMFIKRTVVNRIGIFDEVFGMGNFEDTDFSMRAKREGFKIVRAMASYVYHKESASFKILKSYKKCFEDNRKIFEERWGRQKRHLFILTRADRMDEFSLCKIEKALQSNGWIYIACKTGHVDLKEHSRINIYDFDGSFTLKVLSKILFKKKRFDEIYCDDRKLLRLISILRPIHKASVSPIPQR
ncbi:MAG: hypothetical protein A2Z72_02930 [Omnitrophica bacterium RBG_13_46_9]|nr:MAG: hypothetical protein A2Z72_02930 [Omnitrophica bacterium RBG_13_46_9]